MRILIYNCYWSNNWYNFFTAKLYLRLDFIHRDALASWQRRLLVFKTSCHVRICLPQNTVQALSSHCAFQCWTSSNKAVNINFLAFDLIQLGIESRFTVSVADRRSIRLISYRFKIQTFGKVFFIHSQNLLVIKDHTNSLAEKFFYNYSTIANLFQNLI